MCSEYPYPASPIQTPVPSFQRRITNEGKLLSCVEIKWKRWKMGKWQMYIGKKRNVYVYKFRSTSSV